MMYTVQINVMPLKELLDPQDKTCFFDENKKKSFGDYIVKKWLNVYRPGNIKMIYHTQK